jgi:WD40 repeat protein
VEQGRLRIAGPVSVLLLLCLHAFSQEVSPDKEKPSAEKPTPRLDLYGDPLPAGVIARCGSVRLKLDLAEGSLAFSPDGKRLAAWRRPRRSEPARATMYVCDTSTGATVMRLAGHTGARTATFTDEGNHVLWVDGDGVLWQWDLTTGEETRKTERIVGRSGPIDIAPGGDTLVWTGPRKGKDWSLSRADATTAVIGPSLLGHEHRITALCVSRDGTRIASAGLDGTMLAWDPVTDRPLWQVEAAGNGRTGGLALSSDGDLLASAERVAKGVYRVQLRNGETGRPIRELPGSLPSVTQLRFDPHGRTLVAGGDGGIAAWEVSSGEAIFRRKLGPVSGLAFAPEGKVLGVVSAGHVFLLDPTTGRTISSREGHAAPPDCLAFAPDGKTLASASGDGTVRIWETATGRQVHHLDWPRRGPMILSFTPTGKHLIGCREETRVWDVQSGATRLRLEGVPLSVLLSGLSGGVGIAELSKRPRDVGGFTLGELVPGRLTSLAVSPDGKELAAGYPDGRVRFRSLADGRVRKELQAHDGCVLALAYSPDGKSITTWGTDSRILRIDAGSGGKLAELKAHDACLDGNAAFSPRGRYLAYGDGQRRVHVWDVEKETEVVELPEHPGRIIELRFLGSGRRLLCGWERTYRRARSSDDPIREEEEYAVWDLFLSKPVLKFRSITPVPIPVHAVATSPGGRLAATGGHNYSVQVWDLISGGAVDVPLAYGIFGRSLASADRDLTILLWDLEACFETLGGHAMPMPARSLEQLWEMLAGEETGPGPGRYLKMRGPNAAFLSVWRMARMGDETVAFLGEHMRPSRHEMPEPIPTWIADLGHDEFARRAEASERLSELGDAAAPALRMALTQGVSPEVEVRIKTLLAEVGPPYEDTPNEQLRVLRAVYVLELIGSAEARALLRTLATGSPHTLQTEEARAALERLGGDPGE